MQVAGSIEDRYQAISLLGLEGDTIQIESQRIGKGTTETAVMVFNKAQKKAFEETVETSEAPQEASVRIARAIHATLEALQVDDTRTTVGIVTDALESSICIDPVDVIIDDLLGMNK